MPCHDTERRGGLLDFVAPGLAEVFRDPFATGLWHAALQIAARREIPGPLLFPQFAPQEGPPPGPPPAAKKCCSPKTIEIITDVKKQKEMVWRTQAKDQAVEIPPSDLDPLVELRRSKNGIKFNYGLPYVVRVTYQQREIPGTIVPIQPTIIQNHYWFSFLSSTVDGVEEANRWSPEPFQRPRAPDYHLTYDTATGKIEVRQPASPIFFAVDSAEDGCPILSFWDRPGADGAGQLLETRNTDFPLLIQRSISTIYAFGCTPEDTKKLTFIFDVYFDHEHGVIHLRSLDGSVDERRPKEPPVERPQLPLGAPEAPPERPKREPPLVNPDGSLQ